MSRVGNPYDNAKAESFMKTLKTEEVYAKTYLDLADARRQIGAFIDTVYNEKRLHSALGYKPPVEFEAELRQDNRNHPNQDDALSLTLACLTHGVQSIVDNRESFRPNRACFHAEQDSFSSLWRFA